MKCRIILAIVIGLTGSGFVSPTSAGALSGSEYRPGRIMDDAVFFNPTGMSAAQVQNFLDVKVPVCDTYGNQPYAGTTRKEYAASKGVSTPFICLKDYKQNTPERPAESGLCGYLSPKSGQSAAQIVHDVANACNVNPKVLIVLLQKEQSLITDDWPWPVQYAKATGFACPDTAPCDPSFAGFFYQVHNAARQFKRYSVDSHLFNYKANRNNNILWHPNSACGYSTVFIENQATAGLHNYTPYRPNQAALNNLYGTGDGCSSYGNRNFWRMYNDWFGSTHASYILNVSGSPTLYLQSGNKRYGIPSQDVLRAYGFQNTPITGVSGAYLSSLTDGGTLSTLFTFEGDSGTVRLADNGRQFGIPSSTTCTNWALNCFNTTYQKELPAFLSALIPNGGTVKELMWTPSQGYFKMQAGKKAPIVGSMATLSYTAQSATPISTAVNSAQPITYPVIANNTVVKFSSSASIYYYNSGLYYTFPSFSIYKAWLENTGKIVYSDKISSLATSPPSSSGALDNFVHNGTAKYFINKGKKFDITSLVVDWPSTSDHAFAAPFLGQLPTYTVTSDTLYRDDTSSSIYSVKDKKLNAFPSLRDFYGLGGDKKPRIAVTPDISSRLTQGHLLLADGALFKKSATSSAIYVVGVGNASYGLTEYEQIKRLGLGGVNTLVVNSETTAAYPTSDGFRDFMKVGSLYYTLSRDNKKINYNSTNMSRWGASDTQAREFTAFVGNTIPGSNIDPRFAVATNGVIYYGHVGTKRPIGSYSTYLSLGGNSSNTFSASNAFLSTLPTGARL